MDDEARVGRSEVAFTEAGGAVFKCEWEGAADAGQLLPLGLANQSSCADVTII